jgi:hypothetical protein
VKRFGNAVVKRRWPEPPLLQGQQQIRSSFAFTCEVKGETDRRTRTTRVSMREVNSSAKAPFGPVQALAGKPEDSRHGGDVKKHPRKRAVSELVSYNV